MNSFKIKSFLLVFSLLVLFLLYGCGKKDDPNKIVMWTGMNTEKELKMLHELGAEFEKEYGIKVDIIEIPFSDLQAKFQISAPANQGPDLITGPQDWTGIFAAANLVSPINISEDEKKQFVDVSIAGASYNNKLYAIPLSFEALALIYNKDLIKEPPATMEELFETAEKFTEKSDTGLYKKYGFLIELSKFYAVFPLFSARGTYVFEQAPDGTIDPRVTGLNSAGSIEGAKVVYDLSEYGKYSLIPKDITNDRVLSSFMAKKAAMIVYGPWAINELDKEGMNYGVAPLPPFKDGGVPRPFVSILGIMLSKYAKHSENATKFMIFMNNKENQIKIYEALRRIPSRIEALESDEVKKDDKIQGFYLSAKNGISLPNLPVMSSVWNPMDDALKLIITKKQDNPDEVIKKELNTAVGRISNCVERLLRQ